ncbi:SDR family oxidoreductase [Aurantimonas coralicida]|uniref:SDR family oxidoreductase n=1 Tax=Aurantimonas coralicida TaxID=182270 RepID=UPI00239326F4|nr:SDR family oxidoreductase [Aurantimonas coralicida]MDE0924154.1 SDR family oxidoreductase [Aurantimonas coralicida]
MSGRLEGRRAFVTGAGQGMGRAIALLFAEEGAAVVAASRTLAKMDDLPRLAPSITPVGLDVTDRDAVQAAIAAAGDLDILVNCAGWVHNGSILDCSEEDWAKSLEQNATSCFRTIRAALPGMIARGRGSIINVASVASSITGVANRAAYGASKAAVIGLTKQVARDVIRTGVRVNALCPGTTASPSLESRIAASTDPEATRREFAERQPIGRLGEVSEMAAAALYFAADDAAFTTGQILVVDGGQTL